MALQGSGTIRTSNINSELGRSASARISLDSAENGGYASINTCSPSRPNASNPASMSEWYSYNHTFACCNTPTIGLISSTSSSISVSFTTSNCTTVHIEYSSNGGSSWTVNSGSCTSPRTITGLASNTRYLVRMRITCTSTGGFSGYTGNSTVNTSASCPANGTYLSSYCSGCTLYYRYANGSCGTYDVSQGCSTACGGCCCAPAAGTYLETFCNGCDYVDSYADGCYGSFTEVREPNSPECGCGGGPGPGTCDGFYSDGSGYYFFFDCNGEFIQGEAWYYGEELGCANKREGYTGGYFDFSKYCDSGFIIK